MTAAVTRRRALAGSTAAALGLAASACSPAKGHAAPVAGGFPSTALGATSSPEAVALRAEFTRLASTYHRSCREADAASDLTPEVEPPEALFSRSGDNGLLHYRPPVESWAQPGRRWYGDADLIEKLRADPLRCLDGSPTKGAARRDEIVAAWDRWRADVQAGEDASGYTAAEARFEAAAVAYAGFRDRLVELRTDDPDVMTVKALAIADLCRGIERFEGVIALAVKRDAGAYEDALALSLARDFIGLLGADAGGARV